MRKIRASVVERLEKAKLTNKELKHIFAPLPVPDGSRNSIRYLLQGYLYCIEIV